MSALITTMVLEAAGRLGKPLLTKFIRNRFGAKAEAVTDLVSDKLLEAVAGRAKVSVEELNTVSPMALDEAVDYVESVEAPAIIEYELQSQEAAHRLMLAEMVKGPWYAWAWRPVTMFLIGFLWLWALMLVPLLNAFLTVPIAPVPLTMLMQFTALYIGLYMGGHTVKAVFKNMSAAKG